jgi:hypothetical protein
VADDDIGADLEEPVRGGPDVGDGRRDHVRSPVDRDDDEIRVVAYGCDGAFEPGRSAGAQVRVGDAGHVGGGRERRGVVGRADQRDAQTGGLEEDGSARLVDGWVRRCPVGGRALRGAPGDRGHFEEFAVTRCTAGLPPERLRGKRSSFW